MKRKTLGVVLGMAMVMALPGLAYHIDGTESVTGTPLSTSDWNLGVGNLIICESEGPADDRNDNAGGALHGTGGLCTTGENDATGASAPGATLCAPANIRFDEDAGTTVNDGDKDCGRDTDGTAYIYVNGRLIRDNDNDGVVSDGDDEVDISTGSTTAIDCDGMLPADDADCGSSGSDALASADTPTCYYVDNDSSGTVSDGDDRLNDCARTIDLDRYVALDVCSATIEARNGGNYGPFDPGMAGDCTDGSGSWTTHSYLAEVGAFTCFIPKLGALTDPDPSDTNPDFAFYYSSLYAFWSYDGDGWYTQGSFGGDAHTNAADGPTDNTDDVGSAADGFDNKDAWHGHAAVFIDASDGGSTTGSVVTAVTDRATIESNTLTDNALTALGLDNFTHNCGGSPSDPPSGMIGPAVRGPSSWVGGF